MTYLRNRFVQKVVLLGMLAASATTIHAALPLCNQTCVIIYNGCVRGLTFKTPAQCWTDYTHCLSLCPHP